MRRGDVVWVDFDGFSWLFMYLGKKSIGFAYKVVAIDRHTDRWEDDGGPAGE